MKKVFLGVLLLLTLTSTQLNVNAHPLPAANTAGDGFIEGKIGSYNFSPSEWEDLSPTDPSPSRTFQYVASYDGFLELVMDPSASDAYPPYLYIKTPESQGYFAYQSWSIPIVTRGGMYSILLVSNAYNQTQSGELWYTLAYDGGSGETHSLSADFTVEPSSPKDYDVVTVTSTSIVEGASITGYTWTINGQPQPQLQDSPSFTLNQPQTGSYTVNLVVEDSLGSSDDYTYIFTVDSQMWTLLDSATCTGVQTASPYDALNRKTEFTSGDDVYLWLRLGDVTTGLTVTLHWNNPDYTEKRQSTINIPDPQSQGYSSWSSYTVWDGVLSTDGLYDELMSTPGPWTVNAYADGVVIGSYTFNVAGDLALTLDTTGKKFITGETIPISGQLTFSGRPVSGMTVKLNVNREQSHLEDIGSVTTDSEGRFTTSYTVPKVILDAAPKTHEQWYIEARNEYSVEYGLAQAEAKVLVYPIWLSLDDVKLVQIIEAPVFTDFGGSATYLAADRRAGARVFVTCPNLPFGFNQPEVTVKLSYGAIFQSDITSLEDSVKVDIEDTWIDFFYTLSPARYVVHVEVDPYHRYVDPVNEKTRVESQKKDVTVISKKMNKLSLAFVPVDLGDELDVALAGIGDFGFGVSNVSNMDAETKAAYLAYVRTQTGFMRDVFPLPDSYLDAKSYVYSYPKPMSVLKALTLNGRKYELVKWLAEKSFWEGRKIVGVVPQSDYWWNNPQLKEESGYSAWITYAPPIYQTRSVLVMINSAEGVAAHEVGHTLGLNRWKEEYSYKNWFLGKPVTGLAQKGDRIYDLSKDPERVALYGTPAEPYCFMGSNPGGLIHAWVCDETYPELFKKLKDPPVERVLFVSGQVAGGQLTLDSTIEGSAVPDPEEEGRYTAECQDGKGFTLASYSFGGDAGELGFGFVMAFPEGTRRLVIMENGKLLAEATPSLNKPKVTMGQVSLEGDDVHVDWAGSDADGDKLNYTVLFSGDGGETWQTIITEHQQESLIINAGLLPGGDNCMVKVIAHDGFNTQTVTTGKFKVNPKPPEAFITAPDPGEAQSTLTLQGFGYDPEDGFIVDSLKWSSSIDGLLGYGEALDASLSAGTHVLTLKATDSGGASATAAVEVTVNGGSGFEVVDHVICRGISEDGAPVSPGTVYTASETVYSYVSLTGMSIGDHVEWEFLGPDGLQTTEQLTVEIVGNMYVYAYVELDSFDAGTAAGEWAVDVYVNGARASTGFFDVEQQDSGGRIPFLGAPTLLALLGLLVPVFASRRGRKSPRSG